MSKYLALAFALAVASVGFAQSSAQTAESAVKHYRITFVVDSGRREAANQSFVLDVPVASGKMGAAQVSLLSGTDGDPQTIVQQLFACSDVHATATGLALHISMQSEREAPAIPGLVSARHQHGEFQRTVSLELGQPTVVTQEMRFRVLGNTDPALAEKLKQPAPIITVTAQAL